MSALLAGLGAGMPCLAQPVVCISPIRPLLPSDPRDVQAYADLLRQDFEAYMADFVTYLQCLDAERARVFEEGQEVTNVVVRTGESATSLLVDEIGDVLEPDLDRFEAPPDTVPPRVRELVTGVCKLDRELMLVLDTAKAVDVDVAA